MELFIFIVAAVILLLVGGLAGWLLHHPSDYSPLDDLEEVIKRKWPGVQVDVYLLEGFDGRFWHARISGPGIEPPLGYGDTMDLALLDLLGQIDP